MTRTFADIAKAVLPVDEAVAVAARERHLQLTKPPGSLGTLEDIGVQLAAISGQVPPPVPEAVTVAVFAADHGVVAEGVTAWPQEVTAQMVANFAAGGAAINVLARQFGAQVLVVDVGVGTGTRNLAKTDAMTSEQMTAALDVGVTTAVQAVDTGARLLITGDMGIGNTTAATAVIAALTETAPSDITGRGAGADDATVMRKTRAIERGLARIPNGADPLAVLAAVGGLEIAALAGFITSGAAARIPVIVDGLIADAAALVATRVTPDVRGYLIAGHRSTEPAAQAALDELRLEPLLDLRLRLGEGSGAALALPIVQASARILAEMATFDSAGVSSKSIDDL